MTSVTVTSVSLVLRRRRSQRLPIPPLRLQNSQGPWQMCPSLSSGSQRLGCLRRLLSKRICCVCTAQFSCLDWWGQAQVRRKKFPAAVCDEISMGFIVRRMFRMERPLSLAVCDFSLQHRSFSSWQLRSMKGIAIKFFDSFSGFGTLCHIPGDSSGDTLAIPLAIPNLHSHAPSPTNNFHNCTFVRTKSQNSNAVIAEWVEPLYFSSHVRTVWE